MYWILNYIPLILQIILFSLSLNFKIKFNIDFAIYAVINLFVLPIYLLVVNVIYMKDKMLSFTISFGCMLSVIILNVIVIMVTHKIQTGYFIGDVPEGIYYMLIGIPTVIIIIGMAIIYFLRK